ncbi:MAG TPA: SusC/RagA family TonB-linked outer membrane protein [Ferruginibacter sp.]|nr:SusC/RagA family TonB-linked outer membrane protein [Ferruginibacter sp.]
MRKFTTRLIALCFFLVPVITNAQVTGVVVGDDDNAPLRDVTVTVKGTKTATKTNQAGYYSIQAAKGQVLVFTFVDYAKQEISVGADNKINVRLVQAQKQMGEVVVTAYGLKKSKRELGYTAQDVKGEEISQTQRDNWINALAGRVAGANITPTSGTPGASTTIVLRGAVSIGNSNSPLFVVDGVPYDNQTMNQENLASASNASSVTFANRNSDYGNRAMDLNPEDIESVTILKGPEATALYGSDGASGAIVITTKKGKQGKATVRYGNSFRWEKLYRFPEIQTTYGRGTAGIADPNAVVNPFASGNVYAYFGPKYKEGTQLYDNIGNFFRTGFSQKHTVDVEGGGDITTYRLSGSYFNQEGVIPNTGYEKLTVGLTGSAKVSKKFSINSGITYSNSTTDKASKGAGGYLLNLLNYPSDLDVRDYQNADGSRKLYRSNSSALSAEFDNPFWDVNKNTSQDKTNRVTLTLTLNADPFKWLNLSNTTGLDIYSQTGDFLMHPQSRFGFAVNGFYTVYEQNTKNLSNVFKGTVKKKFGKISSSLTVGFANDDNKTKIEAQRGERFYEINFKSLNNTDPLSLFAKTAVLNTRKVRFFGTASVSYNNLVYASFAGTREGTSTFMSREVDKNPYYNFGSASLSFIFGDLKIFDKLPWFSYGKARISYGTTGKGLYQPYLIDRLFAQATSTGGGFANGVFGNNFGLEPERTQNFEFGGELKFFNNRLSIDITRYSLRSKGQIIANRVSYGTGFVLKYLNGGLVENKGIEAVITGNVIKSKKLNWDVTVNFDRNRGKVIELPAGLPTYYASDTWVFGNLRSQVYPGASISNLASTPILRNTAGQILINPTSGLPSVNAAGDFVIAGDRQPDFKIGLINTFYYKNFTLSFNLDFRKGGDVWNGNEYYLYLTGLSKRTLDRETPVVINGVLNDGLQNTTNPTQNTITVYPYYRSDYYAAGNVSEADFIETVNWMRLRDATLTYNLPKSLLKRQKIISNASVFITGTDLFMITNYTGADPSVNTNTAFSRGYGGAGIDYGSISTPRGLNIGCKVQF